MSAAEFEGSTTKHGTHAGHWLHGERNETPCRECTEARRLYDLARPQSQKRIERSKAQSRAASRALRRLAEMHPGEFRAVLFEEKTKEGLL